MLDPDELIAALRLRVGELIAEGIEYKAENRKLTAIYNAAESLACPIGMEGEVTFNTCSPLVEALMDSFHEYDDGQHKPTKTEEDGNS
jgi:hypothetical protein